MRLAISLLAGSLLGAGAPPATETSGTRTPTGTEISYRVKLLEMEGLAWRGAYHPRLQPVSQRGTVTVWTARNDIVPGLKEKAGKVIATPQVIALPAARSTVFTTKSRRIIAGLSRQADGPVNHASYVAYAPQVEEATEGYSVALTGRALDQGVLVNLSIEDRHIAAVHSVSLSESLEGNGKGEVHPTFQVPEFRGSEVSGEWLIPNEGVLVISLGVNTEADAKGRAVVRERLALIEAQPLAKDASATVASRAAPVPPPAALAAPANTLDAVGVNVNVNAIPMPAPAVPSRALPLPFDAQGMAVSLPPLPAGPAPPTALPGSSEPCATPQLPGVPSGEPVPIRRSALVDPDSTLTSFPVEPACCEAPSDCPFASDDADGPGAKPSPSPLPLLFRFPVNGRLTVEIRASTKPKPSPAPATATAPAKDSPPAALKPVKSGD